MATRCAIVKTNEKGTSLMKTIHMTSYIDLTKILVNEFCVNDD